MAGGLIFWGAYIRTFTVCLYQSCSHVNIYRKESFDFLIFFDYEGAVTLNTDTLYRPLISGSDKSGREMF